jgi:tetratricopeptide (TPR) repeat protein
MLWGASFAKRNEEERNMYKRVLACLLLGLILSGCGATYYGKGKAYLAEEDYDRAIENLHQAVTQDPKKAENWRELGVAYYKKGEYGKALDALKQANLIKPDHKTIFYLGLVYEKKEDFDSAINAYKGYMLLKPKEDMAKKIEIRLKMLMDKRIKEWAKTQMAQEESLEVAEIHPNTVGVTYFRTYELDSSLVVLGRGLAEFMTTDLSKVEELKVVERLRLDRLLEELELGRTDYVDKSTAPRVGKLLGAYQLVTGSVLGAAGEKLRIDAALVLTQTGEVSLSSEEITQTMLFDLGYYKREIDGKLGSLTKEAIRAFQGDRGLKTTGVVDAQTQQQLEEAHKRVQVSKQDWKLPPDRDPQITVELFETGDVKEFFKLEKRLVFGILDSMGLELTREERDAIEEVPTESFLALLAYCRGLDYLDQGMYPEAESQFGKALSEDPNFQEAFNQHQGARDLMEHKASAEDLSNLETAFEEIEAQEKEEMAISDPLGERLTQTNANSSLIQPVTSDNPYTSPIAEGEQTGTVIIEGTLQKK